LTSTRTQYRREEGKKIYKKRRISYAKIPFAKNYESTLMSGLHLAVSISTFLILEEYLKYKKKEVR
jgi:hypothetical protein